MYAFIVRRIVATVPVMAVVVLIVFLLLHLGPGDPATLIAGDYATADQVAQIREKLGLHLPLHEQFLQWSTSVFKGDLGVSIYSNMPVTKLIRQGLGPTFALAVATLTFSVVFAVPMGIIAAWKANTWIDKMVMVMAVVAFSFPVFVIGYILVYGASLQLRILPVQGYRSISEGLIPFIRHLILPTISLGAIYIALIARITRASVLSVLNEDYIRTAKAKGLSDYSVLVGHATRSAAVPIVTVVGVGFALLISGVVVTESVFVIPGLGRMTADAILRRDYPVIQGLILLFSFSYVLINLVVDILYTVFDPRIRY
jgi:peptide/nickel transport system permease protein